MHPHVAGLGDALGGDGTASTGQTRRDDDVGSCLANELAYELRGAIELHGKGRCEQLCRSVPLGRDARDGIAGRVGRIAGERFEAGQQNGRHLFTLDGAPGRLC